MNPELIKSTIDNLPNLPDDELVYIYKCSLSYNGPNKSALKPLISAIEKQRKLNGKSREIQDTPPIIEDES